MIRLLYNFFFPIGLLLFLPTFLLKMVRRGNYRHKFGQRFGFYDSDVAGRLRSQRRTWIHAVSVGEVMIALKLAVKLKEADPELHVALTTTTTTGFAFANREAPRWMETIYTPLDFWPIMRRAFNRIRPQRIILVEAEVWPNFAALAHARKVPLALVNARLSKRSEKRFRFFKFAVAPMFRCLDLVCVPEPEDAARWEALGVAPGRIRQLGNIKYDAEGTKIDAKWAGQTLAALGLDAARPVIFGGSTHPGEETILAETFLALRAEFPSLLLIVAPRHVERSRSIKARVEQLSLRVMLRSDAPPAARSAVECLLIDSTGELRNWYSVATVTFVGKSLTEHGGQNPVEPSLAGSVVLFGPHMENFAALARSLVAERAAIQIADKDSLCRECASLLRDPGRRESIVANALKVFAAHRGATARTAELVRNLRSHRAVET